MPALSILRHTNMSVGDTVQSRLIWLLRTEKWQTHNCTLRNGGKSSQSRMGTQKWNEYKSQKIETKHECNIEIEWIKAWIAQTCVALRELCIGIWESQKWNLQSKEYISIPFRVGIYRNSSAKNEENTRSPHVLTLIYLLLQSSMRHCKVQKMCGFASEIYWENRGIDTDPHRLDWSGVGQEWYDLQRLWCLNDFLLFQMSFAQCIHCALNSDQIREKSKNINCTKFVNKQNTQTKK